MSIARVNHNVMAMGAYRNLSVVQKSLNDNIRRFSTGLRIETAKDDATGLAISERFRAQITGYETANKNAQDANNLLQVADGALNESHAILQRLRQLSITAANEATTDSDRLNIQTEVNQLLEELDTISATTQYNGRALINGDLQGSSSSVDAKATVVNNVNVNMSTVQGTANTELVDEDTIDINADASLDVTFEIRLVANSANTSQVDAVVYASDDSTKQADGSYKLNIVATVSDVSGNATTDLGAVLTTAGYGTIDLDLNQVSTADIGRSAMVKLESQVAAVTDDKALSFQVRANMGQSLQISLGDMSTKGLRIRSLDVTNRLAGQNAIGMLDSAIQRLSTQRANVGAFQQRISSTISANELNIINQRSAESRIRDVDFAEETLSFTRNNILIQSGTSVLAQANAAPQSVLSLLQG